MSPRFDARSFGRPHLDGGAHEDEAGMLAAVATIGQLVAGEVDDGIPSERIVVGGFSQGSVISLLTGLTNERRLAGLVCLSGWLGLSGKAAELQTAHAKELAIFWGHGMDFCSSGTTFSAVSADSGPLTAGTSDPVVPYTRAQESVELLQGLGFGQVELHTYSGMPHSLCAQEQQDVAEFIAKVSMSLRRPWGSRPG